MVERLQVVTNAQSNPSEIDQARQNLTPCHLVRVISCDLNLEGVTAANRVGNNRGPSIMDPYVLYCCLYHMLSM